MYNYVLFDWDGCLAQSLDSWVSACREALVPEGITANETEVWQAMSSKGVLGHFTITQPANFKKRVTKILLAKPHDKLYHNVLLTLQAKPSKVHFGIVSNTRHAVLHKHLTHYGINDYFKVVIDDASGTPPKPNPDGILRALKQLGGTRKQTLFIGDAASDLQAARSAGVDSALFYPLAHQKRYNLSNLLQHKPTHILHDFAELSDLLTPSLPNNARLKTHKG